MQENNERNERGIDELENELALYERLAIRASNEGNDADCEWFQYCCQGVMDDLNRIQKSAM